MKGRLKVKVSSNTEVREKVKVIVTNLLMLAHSWFPRRRKKLLGYFIL